MAKNLVNTTRNLKMIPDGPLAGWLDTSNALGIPSVPDPVPSGSFYTPYAGNLFDTAPAGFRQINLASAIKIIYRSKGGSDGAGRGLSPSLPVYSSAAVNSLLDPTKQNIVLFERGFGKAGSYDLNLKTGTRNGLSQDYPMVIGWYGTGDRPVIELTGTMLWNISGTNIGTQNILITGLDFWYSPADPAAPNYSSTSGSGHIQLFEGHQNIHFEDCGSEFIEWEVQKLSSPIVPTNIRFSHMLFRWGAYTHNTSISDSPRPSTMFIQNAQNLHTEFCVFDYGGWHPTEPNAGANQYCHTIYHQYGAYGTSCSHTNNIIARGASHGIQMRGGGRLEDNFVARCANGLLLANDAGGGNFVPDGGTSWMLRNGVTEGWPMVRGQNACSDGPTGAGGGARILCTGAVYGLDYGVQNPNADWRSENNYAHTVLLAGTDYAAKGFGLSRNDIVYSQGNSSAIDHTDDRTAAWDTDSQNVSQYQQLKTLADYYAHLTGEAPSFDGFMNIVKNRPIRSRNTDLEAQAINNFCRPVPV